MRLDVDKLARCALDALATRYPHKLDHLIIDEHDRPEPSGIHPVFDGCYDWHSSVHMHWSLLQLRPYTALHEEIDARFDARFARELVDRERAYAAHPARRGFERPYGWAWLLALQLALDAQADGDERVRRWADALAPFSREVAGRLCGFIQASPYPVRAGTHANSAFAMILAREYAQAASHDDLLRTVDAAAVDWFGPDQGYPARYEPSGADFLSPGLCEALLMSGVLGDSFAAWWRLFEGGGAALSHWSTPVLLGDMTDTQLIHLAGLNLSRAWCLRALASRVTPLESEAMLHAAGAHERTSLPFVADGDFVGTHWLVTFLLLSSRPARSPRRT
jgi:hypothetical protein